MAKAGNKVFKAHMVRIGPRMITAMPRMSIKMTAGQVWFISISRVNGVTITAVTAGVLCQAATDRCAIIMMSAWDPIMVQWYLACWAAHHVLTTTVAASQGISRWIVACDHTLVLVVSGRHSTGSLA